MSMSMSTATTQIHRVFIKAPPQAIWDAITDPARLADWWLPFDADITVDLRPGGLMVMSSTGDEPFTITDAVNGGLNTLQSHTTKSINYHAPLTRVSS